MVTKIILVGMMGAGKTTVGKLLAKKLDYFFCDIDKKIEEKSGVKINTIFEFEGEEGFREREHLMLQDSLNLDKVIISTGGGIITNQSNRDLLKSEGAFVIYLKASLQILNERLKNDKTRPMLNEKNKLDTLNLLLRKREGFYEEVASLVIDTTQIKSTKVIDVILRELNFNE